MTHNIPKPAPASRLRVGLSVALATLCGCAVALQSRINGQLGSDLGDGFVAALISFGSGLIVISLVLLVSRPGRRGVTTVIDAIRRREIPWWHTAGGVAGGLFVLSQGLVVGLLGIALFTVAAVAGQTISGMVIDSRGIGTVAPKAITVTRIVGATLALISVVIAVLPQISDQANVWVIIFPFGVGLLLGWQQAVNGQIKSLAGSATTATFFNFVGGTIVLAVFAAINLLLAGLPHGFPSNPVLYLGGIIGVLFIAGFAAVIPIIGVLLQSLAAVSGQLLMALVLDFVAPTNTAGVAVLTIAGTVLTLIAVVIASIRSRTAIRVRRTER
ncbi:MAG: bacterial/archaeal transporter family-2 protein [Actinomycetota bacterium]|jgi:transporter family-2 protein|nr:bacterial/archaeal transporter family-2 protein [Actinomycetota bacterium]